MELSEHDQEIIKTINNDFVYKLFLINEIILIDDLINIIKQLFYNSRLRCFNAPDTINIKNLTININEDIVLKCIDLYTACNVLKLRKTTVFYNDNKKRSIYKIIYDYRLPEHRCIMETIPMMSNIHFNKKIYDKKVNAEKYDIYHNNILFFY